MNSILEGPETHAAAAGRRIEKKSYKRLSEGSLARNGFWRKRPGMKRIAELLRWTGRMGGLAEAQGCNSLALFFRRTEGRGAPAHFGCGGVLTSLPRQCISLESLAGEFRFHVALYGPHLGLHPLPRTFCPGPAVRLFPEVSSTAARGNFLSWKINQA
jgi:hypothetical protein